MLSTFLFASLMAFADEPEIVYNDIDVSSGGALAEPVRLHRDTYAAWLAEPDYNTWTNYTNGSKPVACRPKIVRLAWGEEGRSLVYTNLCPGTTYAWSVRKLSGETLTGCFTTESAAPRWISAPVNTGKGDYVMNMRDLGGWEVAGGNGRRTNFGVFYRSAMLDRFFMSKEKYRLGCPLSNELRIKTELDLRGEAPVTNAPAASILDEVYFFTTNVNTIVKTGVGFTAAPCDDTGTMRYYRVAFADGIYDHVGSGARELRDAFHVLGQKANHPVIFHCAGGRDRTGLLAFLIEALVGVREDDLFRDHLSIVFGKQGQMWASRVDGYLRDLYTAKDGAAFRFGGYGDSLAGHVRAYLEWCGVTTAELAAVTEALTGETPDQVLARVDAEEAARGFRTVWYVNPLTGATGAVHRVAAGVAPHDPVMLDPDGKDPVRYCVNTPLFAGWGAERRVDAGNAVKSAILRDGALPAKAVDGDTFEPFAPGTPAASIPGWTGGGAVVNETPDASAGFPADAATHTNVLAIAGRATRTFGRAGQEPSRYEMLFKVERTEGDLDAPAPDARLQFAVDANGYLVVWQDGAWVRIDPRARAAGEWVRLRLEEREGRCRITVDGVLSPVRPALDASVREMEFSSTALDDLVQQSLKTGIRFLLR